MSHPRHPYWRLASRVLFVAFLCLVAWLLLRAARAIHWDQVRTALVALDATTLATAAALVVLSYFVYACYDLAARRYAHHALPKSRVLMIAVASYAFSLNLGALVGAAGFRYRLYSRSGLGAGAISRVIVFSISTNWLGYVLLGGALFTLRCVPVPPGWEWGMDGLQWAGVVMLLLTLGYLVACHRLHGRMYHVRGHHFRFPELRLALVQLALSCMHWSLMARVIDVLLPPSLPYATVLGVLLLAGMASAMAHIPAGIGVLEAVFVAMLGHTAPSTQIIAALLAYRALYYLAPLLVAIALYVGLEVRGRSATARRSPD